MKEGDLYKRGLWTVEEDKILTDYIRVHGEGRWNRIHKMTGLKRGGKSCRLRWMNYLNPYVKKGNFSEEEEDLIIRLHKLLGNRWSLIAGRVPGRTDNQVKNHWNTHLRKKLGIKRGKETEVDVPSRESGGDNETLSLPREYSSPKLPSSYDGNGGERVNEGVLSSNYIEEPASSEFFMSLFRFSSDNLNQNSPEGLMELPVGYPLDVLWHDL